MRRICLAFLLSGPLLATGQQPEPPSLTAEQQTLFDAAKKNFREHHPELALEKMKQLHAMLPENPMITDGTAETAVTLGDDSYALSLLQPWAATHPEDSVALELLARAYAETGGVAERDKTITAVFNETTTNQQFKLADRLLWSAYGWPMAFWTSTTRWFPFSGYHIYMLGRQVDANNALVQQITLESNDIDQVGFAKEHPDLVAKGMHRFRWIPTVPAKPALLGQRHKPRRS